LAKEKMTRLDDQTVNSVVAALAKVDLNANTLSLLIAIGKKYPRFPAGLAHLLRRG